MPSNYSPSLKLELIQSGEQPGFWGNTTNKNLGTLLEQAIVGTTSVDVTAGDVILTSLNGLPDEARSATLYVFGTPLVTRVITIPDAFKNYTVQNATANIVQIKTAVGTAFDCPPLSHSYINCNDSDVVVGRSITNGANTITSSAAPFNSPAFTGTPTAPTAALNTNTTQIATTAFVNAEIAADTANLAPLASPALTGTPTAPTAAVTTNTTQIATTAFVNAEIANDAPTKTGGGASGTWSISISGNAATATSATSATNATNATNAVNVTGTVGVANGGTGLTSVASGRLLYGSGGTPLSTSANLTFNGTTLTVNNVAVSARTTESNGGTQNTAVGNSALSTSVSGGNYYESCTAVGYFALKNNTTGLDNTAVGDSALLTNTSGSSNTAVGINALRTNISTTGNTAIGNNALYNATAGSNTAVGSNALYNISTAITGADNIGIGRATGQSLTTGTNNIIIHSGGSAVFGVTTTSNRIVMGNTSATNAYVQVAWTVVSDARDKMNFAPVPHGLDFVKELNPISYQFKEKRDVEVPHGPVRYGFKAQDILALEGNSPIIIDAEDPDKLRYNGEALVPVLVNAIKELSAQVEQMKVELAALKG